MAFNEKLHNFQYNVFTVIIYVTWSLYIIIALGLSATAPQYLDELQSYVKIYVSLFLLWRFNPFRNVQFTKLDSKIAFSAGLLLLATTFINTILQKIIHNL
jgi:hypothetical protein